MMSSNATLRAVIPCPLMASRVRVTIRPDPSLSPMESGARPRAIILLALGMGLAITGSTMVAVAPDLAETRRWMVMLALVLMAAGFAAVARRTAGWIRPVVRIVAVLQLAWLGWVLARPRVPELADWQYRVLAATLWWSGIALLTIAARAWWRPGNAIVVVAAVIAVTLEAVPWAPYLAPAFDDLVTGAPEPWIRPLRELVTSAAILILVRAIQRPKAVEASSDKRRAGTRTRRWPWDRRRHPSSRRCSSR